MPTTQPGMNSSGGVLALPLEFRILLLIAGAFVVLSMGLSQVVQERGGHPAPKWTRRYGAMAEFITATVAVITTLAASVFAIAADLEPALGPVLLTVLAIFPEIICIRALMSLGRQRAWVWAIRSGSHLQQWFTFGFLLLDLAIVSAVILHIWLSS